VVARRGRLLAVPACRIYLGGPEVFLPDGIAIGAEKKAICARYGFEGCFPLDVEPDPERISRVGAAGAIFAVCVELMAGCELMIANMTPFRSVSMDVGTAVEVGFMYASGKRVFGYSNRAADYRARVEHALGSLDSEVESFGLADNLMCVVPVEMSGGTVVRREVEEDRLFTDLSGFELCVGQAAAVLGMEPVPPGRGYGSG
jgi:nucleoside 2-deoxyribosyltransferase